MKNTEAVRTAFSQMQRQAENLGAGYKIEPRVSPDGGHITISAGRLADRVWMVVDDDGIGIPPEDRPRIFERFYRVDKARSRQSGGTGLGLSIAQEIVRRHQGQLTLLDKEGPGLAVRLELKIEGPDHG